MAEIEDPLCAGYKEEDGQKGDGFMFVLQEACQVQKQHKSIPRVTIFPLIDTP